MGYWESIIYTCKQLSIQTKIVLVKGIFDYHCSLGDPSLSVGHKWDTPACCSSSLSVLLVSVSAPPLPSALLF